MTVEKLIQILRKVKNQKAKVWVNDLEDGYGHHVTASVCIVDSDGDVIIA